ncbi:MAG: ABC transporter ATP-binding protein [Leptospiraceae bacterium]|nr:ABC transporter ATP-binding protein [Leptospiraceae bacterium]MCP5499167.1 ABC transporter ATP-binding protein [Leptospiraceae bacterium]
MTEALRTEVFNSTHAIEIENVNKIYPLYDKPLNRVKEALNPFRKKYHHDFYALSNISLNIKKGDTIGIIGQNGSGKSTLLKIITGVLQASSGRVSVNGRISSLLELGAGFNPELTGIENVYFNGMINGLTKKEVEEKLNDILEFSDIGEFAYQPVKIYSSGMFVRLAFSCAIYIEPDILIVDEALSVGDAYFQVKSINRMKKLIEAGCTVLFVSHDPGTVRTLCKTAYLLHEGKILQSGEPLEVFDFYNSLISLKDKERIVDFSKLERDEIAKIGKRTGNFKIKIESIQMLNEKGKVSKEFISGEKVEILIRVYANESVEKPTFGIAIRDRLGNDIFGINNMTLHQDSINCLKGNSYTIQYSFPMNLGAGIYSLTVAIHGDRTHVEDCYDWVNDAIAFTVISSSDFSFTGYCRIKPDFSISGPELN